MPIITEVGADVKTLVSITLASHTLECTCMIGMNGLFMKIEEQMTNDWLL